MNFFNILAFATLFVTISMPVRASELPSQKLLTLDMARTIAEGALEQCRANGYKVTVTVVDASNSLKTFLRDDGSALGTIEIGRMKANTAMMFGHPSGPPANLAPGAVVSPPLLPGTTNLLGGLPIKVGEALIGAVSVSGAPGGDKDTACAAKGLEKVADGLK